MESFVKGLTADFKQAEFTFSRALRPAVAHHQAVLHCVATMAPSIPLITIFRGIRPVLLGADPRVNFVLISRMQLTCGRTRCVCAHRV
jgi:hypothetical protein